MRASARKGGPEPVRFQTLLPGALLVLGLMLGGCASQPRP